MARYHPYFEEKLKRAIRDAMAIDPLMNKAALHEHLEKQFNHSFDLRFIGKLCDKVLKQAYSEVDRAKLTPRLSQLRETHRVASGRLMNVLFWTPDTGLPRPLARDIVEATKNLVMLDIAVMNAEVANGLYKNLSEAVSKRDHYEMPEEQRRNIISAFSKWGLLPPGSMAQFTERTMTLHAPTNHNTADN